MDVRGQEPRGDDEPTLVSAARPTSPPVGLPLPPPPRRLRMVSEDTYPDWEAIYRDNVERLYRLMYAKVGNRADAEDLTTEVFLAALRPLRRSATVGEVRAYLLATARTVLANHWRRTLGLELTTVDGENLPASDVVAPVNEGARARAAEILAALPPRYEEILRLRFLRAYTIKEAAAHMRISVSNAKVLQFRALREAAAQSKRSPS
jgi:RNA polymerase sigma-70 factor (ECF subfamily)